MYIASLNNYNYGSIAGQISSTYMQFRICMHDVQVARICLYMLPVHTLHRMSTIHTSFQGRVIITATLQMATCPDKQTKYSLCSGGCGLAII